MTCGITPSEALMEDYKEMKAKGTVKCLILEIEIDSYYCLDVVFKGDQNFYYKDLFDHLPDNQPRYVLLLFDYETDENPPRKTDKILFIFWCPLAAPVKQRFTYWSSLQQLGWTLGSVQKIIQAADLAELEYDNVRKKLLE